MNGVGLRDGVDQIILALPAGVWIILGIIGAILLIWGIVEWVVKSRSDLSFRSLPKGRVIGGLIIAALRFVLPAIAMILEGILRLLVTFLEFLGGFL